MRYYSIILLMSFLTSFSTAAQSKKAMSLYQKAVSEFREGNSEKGFELLEKSMEKASGNFHQPFTLAGDKMMETRQYQRAIDYYENSLLAQELSSTYAKMSLAYKGLYRWDEAVVAYETYLEKARLHPRMREEAEKKLKQIVFASEEWERYVTDSASFTFEKTTFSDDKMEYFPCITGDSKGLIFTARDFSANSKDENLYGTFRDGESWTAPKPLEGRLNSTQNEGAATISADGMFMVFTACNRPNGAGSCDLFYSYWLGDAWDAPRPLEGDVNTERWESQPSLGPDGKTLYFVRGSSSTSENIDIYTAEFNIKSERWENVHRLPSPINTPGRETAPFIHFDGKSLVFCASREPSLGGTDFYISQRVNDTSWTEPENLGMPYNSFGDEFSMVISPSGNTGFMASTRSAGLAEIRGSMELMDIYEFNINQSWQPSATTYQDAIVIDALNKRPIGRATVKVFSEQTTEEIYAGESRPHTGYVRMMLPSEERFGLTAYAKGYAMNSLQIETSEGQNEPVVVELMPLEHAESFTLNNILFDLDLSTLKPSSYRELRLLLDWLNEKNSVNIKIIGHTDNQGSHNYNVKLSKNRAESVAKWLIDNGIDPNRLSTQGLGDSRPIADNSTEAGRAKNRRTEIQLR